MNEILYRKTTKDDMEILMKLRLEMLREVNDLSGEYEYDEKFISESRRYFESGEQTTVIALDGQTPVGCASLSYIWIMPTFSHPTGNRAHPVASYVWNVLCPAFLRSSHLPQHHPESQASAPA